MPLAAFVGYVGLLQDDLSHVDLLQSFVIMNCAKENKQLFVITGICLKRGLWPRGA